jgi:UDP-N-acetylmuramoylalanine--D-glutamate ligase
MKIAILGFGREGNSILGFLKKNGLYKNADVWIVDKKATIKLPRGVRGRLGKNCLRGLEKFDLIFRSPGIPYNLPELKHARQRGTKFSSATKLFFENLRYHLPPTTYHLPTIIGITGTKGKSITTTLLYKILKNARKPALLAGNIGTSALDVLPRVKKNSIVILELSSFQLQDLEVSPRIAVVLEVFPDHQDLHLNLREYYEAKTNIARHQKPADKIFFFKNSALGRWAAKKSRGKKVAVDEKNFRLFKPADLKMPGFHNFKNAVMAATVAAHLGVPRKTIIKTAKNFRGLEHRLEFVRRISINQPKNQHKSAYLDFYNDSASTNPQTAAAAIRAFPNEAKILIAGGLDKGLNYKPLADALKNSNTKLVILFGENKSKIKRQIANSRIRIVICENLRTAIKIAYRFAKNLPPTTYHLLPTVILFSPAAASFDMFRDYADRGQRFKKLINKLR